MTASMTAPVALGLDGFAVCLALGPLGFGRWRTMPLIGLFGLCDGLALLAGGALHPYLPWTGTVLPVVLGLWAILVLLTVVSGARVLPLLPVPLAFDNLLAGAAADRAVTLEDAALSCAVSAALAGAGLLTGRTLALHLPLQPTDARLAGAGLLLVAGCVAIAG